MSRARFVPVLFLLSAISLYGSASSAQDVVPTGVTDQNRSGDLPFSSVVGTELEHVVISTENLVVNIPIAHVRGRAGLDFDFGLRYDGRFLALIPPSGPNPAIWWFSAHDYVPSNGIWQTNQPTLSFTSYTRTACQDLTQGSGGTASGGNGFVLQDQNGAAHALDVSYETASCPNGNWSYSNSGPDTDNSGFWAALSGANNSVTVTGPNGVVFGGGNGNASATLAGQSVLLYGSYEDSNGNLTNNSPGGLDTLGRQIVTQTNGSNQVIYSVRVSDGSIQNYTANYANISIHTAFGYGQQFVGTRSALTSLVLPNGRSYTFAYDSYGSLTNLGLPTGATVAYTWANTSPGLGMY